MDEFGNLAMYYLRAVMATEGEEDKQRLFEEYVELRAKLYELSPSLPPPTTPENEDGNS